REAAEIERGIATFARSPNGGLTVTAGGATQRHRNLIIALAARHKLPAVYNERTFVAGGGVISYGPQYLRQYRLPARLRGPLPTGREACRPAGAGSDQVRTGDQPEDSQGSRHRSACITACPRGRGDRMKPAP